MDLLKNLNIDPLAILVNLVGFVLLLFIANKLVFKPIGKVIDERQGEIAADYNKVDTAKSQMESARVEYQQRLAKSKRSGAKRFSVRSTKHSRPVTRLFTKPRSKRRKPNRRPIRKSRVSGNKP